MFGGNFYNQTIRRAVSVFGTIFNDINIIRRDSAGNVLNMQKVPLAYGPKHKFLSRIDQQDNLNDPTMAIKLPRLSFEITTLAYDGATKMQKGYKSRYLDGGKEGTDNNKTVLGPVNYNIGFQLNIFAKNQDDALQILEQILPFFQPDYTVTVKQVDDNFSNDMPIVLSGVSLSDDYEGDYLSRRVIVYSLDFESKIKFYGPVISNKVIKQTLTSFYDNTSPTDDSLKFLERQNVEVIPRDNVSEDDPHTKDITYSGLAPERIILVVDNGTGFAYANQIIGLTSGTIGFISDINNNQINIVFPDGVFEEGETISIVGQATTAVIVNQTEVWN